MSTRRRRDSIMAMYRAILCHRPAQMRTLPVQRMQREATASYLRQEALTRSYLLRDGPAMLNPASTPARSRNSTPPANMPMMASARRRHRRSSGRPFPRCRVLRAQ